MHNHKPLSEITRQDSGYGFWFSEDSLNETPSDSTYSSIRDAFISTDSDLSDKACKGMTKSLQQPGYFGPFRIVPKGGTTAFASEILRIIVQNHQDTSLQNCHTSESKLPMPPNSQI
jgi:hypothetical protein